MGRKILEASTRWVDEHSTASSAADGGASFDIGGLLDTSDTLWASPVPVTESFVAGSGLNLITAASGVTIEIDDVGGPAAFLVTAGAALHFDNAVAFSCPASVVIGSNALDLPDMSFGANAPFDFSAAEPAVQIAIRGSIVSASGDVPAPVTVTDGATVEINGVSAQSVTFAGTTGTLRLDSALSFTGTVSGLSGSDALDLADVSFGAITTAIFLGNNTAGTLTVSDGTHTANINLLGNYLSSSWTLSSDGHGGTLVIDPVSSNNWQTLEIGAGGYVTGIDIAPDDTMVVRTDTYGAYIWDGTEWQQLVSSTSMPAGFVIPNSGQGVYEIQIAPSNSNIMYMMFEGDVFQSTNKGTSWTETAFTPVSENPNDAYRMDGQKMAVDPENPDVVYVGTPQNGLFVTTNGGATWQNVSAVPVSQTDSNGIYPGITGIEFDPALGGTGGATNTIFAASYGNGVYESTNVGASWSAIGGPTAVEYAAVSSTGVYYAVSNNESLWSYKSDVWTELLVDAANGIQSVAVDPFNANEIVVQTPDGSVNVSYNAGATWTGASSWANQLSSNDIPWLAETGPYMTTGGTVFDQLVPNELWTSAGVGVWNTTLPTENFQSSAAVVWNDQSLGIEQLVANEIIVPPGGEPVVASWDRPFFYISNAGAYPSTYSPVMGDQIVAGWSIDYASSNPKFLVGIADWWGAEESGYSTDGGQSWTPFPSFVPGAGSGNIIGGTIAASSPTNIVWAPADGNHPYYTLDGGETWNPISLPGVSGWSGFDSAYYYDTRTVTADRVLSNTFYLYYAGHGVYETTNGGSIWTQVYSGQISAYSNYNAELESVPGEAGNLFFTGGIQSSFSSEGFYQSSNQGAAWTAVANVTEVNCVGFGAPAPGQSYPSIYIVGYVQNVYGIWQSNDDAKSWIQIGTYPTGVLDQITTISGDPNNYGQVYVGFDGAGYAYLPASPVVDGISASPANGVEILGNSVTLTLNMSEAVTVNTTGGTPTLTLNDGGTATYTGGSGSSALTFSYTVAAGQNTPDLTVSAVNLNGATVADAAGNAGNLSLSGLTQTGPQIDTTVPTVSSVVASGSDISSGRGDLSAGHVVTLTLNMSEAVTVNTTGGTPTLTLNDGGTATYTGGSGSSVLTFSYTVAAGQNTPDLTESAVNLNGATIADAVGNNASLSGTFNPTGTLQIDTTIPTVSSVAASGSGISSGSGDLSAGHVVTLTLTMSEAVTINTTGGTPTLTLNDGATATYTGGSGSNALTFSYTVAAGQNTPDLTVSAINLNGAAIADAAGNNASLSGTFNPTGTLPIDTTNPPPPIISTDAINANNSITLTGTAEANSTLTIDDGQTVLGTTTTTAGGVWNYTTGALGSGAQVFTAVATDAAGNTSALSNSVDPIIGSATTAEIAAIYNAVLQRAPTDTEVTASLAIDSTLGSSVMTAAIVNSAEAFTNVYPLLQMLELAFGHFPSAATLASMASSELNVTQLSEAVVASQTFANTFNGGTLLNPNAPVTAAIVEALCTQAVGHAPTQSTLAQWLNSGLSIEQSFDAMVTSQSYLNATLPSIEQYLTAAAGGITDATVANADASNVAGGLTATQINALYEAVLQRAPSNVEVTASLALDSATSNAATVAAIVDSAEAITNIYPILETCELAFGYLPQASTLASMAQSALTVSQLSYAIVDSQTFANMYNGGTLIDPNSPVTASIVDALCIHALGHAPTQTTLSGWLNAGLTVAEAFQDMVTSQSYFQATQFAIEGYLTATAINEAALTTINGALATGTLALGTTPVPLTEAGLTVLGGSGALTVVASGASDTITELNTSTAGGTITASGADDTIITANGANTITANVAGDTISLGAISTGNSITSAQTIHAAGAGDIITFATTAADGTALTWAALSTVDGGNGSTGIGANSTVSFGNNTGGGSETVVVTGDLAGATTSGGTSTSGIAMTTLGNVVDSHGDLIVFGNATTEVLAGTSAVNVSSAGSLAQALDMAALAAAQSQSGATIGAHTAVIDWFQYSGNTYVLEAINNTGTPQTHSALVATDELVKIIGLVNLSGESIAGHTLTL
jgi:hypothetical protein